MSDISIRRIPPRYFGGPIRNTASWEIIDDAGYVIACVDRGAAGMFTVEPRPDEYGYTSQELVEFIAGISACKDDWKDQQYQPKLSPQLVKCDELCCAAKCDHCDQPATYVNDTHKLCENHNANRSASKKHRHN